MTAECGQRWVDAGLARAYAAARYVVRGPRGAVVLRLGEAGAADGLLPPGADTWALVTAHNPGSRRWPRHKNRAAHAALRARLAGAPGLWPAHHQSPGGTWREEALFVAGLGEAEAVALGAELGQAAVVVGVRGGPPRLAWCPRRHRS